MATIDNNTVSQKSLPKFLFFCLFVFLSFLLYANVLHGEFISDDYVTIVDNPAVRDFSNLSGLWNAFNARSLVGFSFALNYHFHELNVFGYHLVNILFHGINAFLVFQFFLLLSRTPWLKRSFVATENFTIGLLGGLLFLVHPIQTQAVAFITQRAVLFGTFFYLSVLLFYLKYRLTGKNVFWIASLLSLLLGMISKENIVTVPLMLLALEVMFFPKLEAKRPWSKRALYWIVCLFQPMILFMDKTGSVLDLKKQVSVGSFDLHYFFTEIEAFCQYIRLVFLPVNQTHHYDFPLSGGLLQPSTLICCFFVAILILIGIMFYKKERWVSFGILWIFISSSVEAGAVILVHRKVIDEHWFYLPMVGASLLLSYFVVKIFKERKKIFKAAVVLLAMLAFFTFQRNKVWQTEIGFWKDVLAKAPFNRWSYIGAGRAYERKGQLEAAQKIYEQGLQFSPDSPLILNGLGVIASQKGQDALALKYLDKALEYNPDFAKAYNNIAFIYYLDGKWEKALVFYQKSLDRQGDYPDAYFYMGQCLLALKETDRARDYFKKALHLYQRQKTPGKVKIIRTMLHDLDPAT